MIHVKFEAYLVCVAHISPAQHRASAAFIVPVIYQIRAWAAVSRRTRPSMQ